VTTNPIDEPAFRLRTSVLAFYKARRRYRNESEKTDATVEDVFIPLTEALWWACSVDEGFEDLDGTGYKTDRDQDTRGRVLRGLRYARNRCGHQRAMIVERSYGHTFPVTFPLTYTPFFTWRPLNELPPPDPKFRDQEGKDAYRKSLARKPAADTLDYTAQWFATAQNRPGSAASLGPWPSST
jgi:hypothetical protein